MAFSEFELALIDRTAGALVRRRQPPAELQAKLRLGLEIEGHKVRIYTLRPAFRDPSEIIRSDVAQFTYNRSKGYWKLYWKRSDGRWHAWDPAENMGSLEKLVKVVDEDRYGGFWG